MRLFVIVLGMVLSPVAWGHGIHAAQPGLVNGLLHPMTGIDHVLAAIGMGGWLGIQHFRRWSVSLYMAALVTGLVFAGVWTVAVGGMSGDIEWILAFSLIVVGLLLWQRLHLPQPLVATFTAAVFSCHFYAHITEMPALNAAGAAFYAGGFFIGTALMIATAAVVARGGRASPKWARLAGAVIATAGVTALGVA